MAGSSNPVGARVVEYLRRFPHTPTAAVAERFNTTYSYVYKLRTGRIEMKRANTGANKEPKLVVDNDKPIKTENTAKPTGGSNDYYSIDITSPSRATTPYTAECIDIITALDMSFAEGNVFKAIWRRAAARKGMVKPGHNARYDAEKIVFFGQRLVEQER